jgi:hypothetical protein
VSAPAAHYIVGEDGSLAPAVRPKAAPYELTSVESDAIGALVFMVGWNGGVMPVYRNGRGVPSAFVDCKQAPAWDLAGRALRARDGDQVEVGLPEVSSRGGGPSACTCLWVWVESKDSARRAGRFRPLPSLVLRMGGSCRRLLLWALEEVVPYPILVAHNKRLAYFLRCPQKWAEPEKLRIPLPGTFLRVGRVRPCPVVVTRVSEDTFPRVGVGGRLREPPAPFMDRLRRGEIKR